MNHARVAAQELTSCSALSYGNGSEGQEDQSFELHFEIAFS